MTGPLNEHTQALSLPRLVAPDIADAFVRTLWKNLAEQRAEVQTHQQDLVRKNAIEIHGRNYTPLQALHWGLTPTVARLLNTDLLPSFAYFRLYFGGDICRVHSDRPACEVSLSLKLGSSHGHPWALCIGTRPIERHDGPAEHFGDEPFESYAMTAGDAVLYRGSVRRHGRLDPNPNDWSAHVFLQWVERHGPHAGEAFERIDLGEAPSFLAS